MELYVVGTGGAGRETLDVARAAGEPVAAFLDERTAGTVVRELRVLGLDDVSSGRYVIGIADPAVRRRLAGHLQRRGLVPARLVHPRAVVAPGTALGVGCVVMAGAHVSSDVLVGDHVHVQYNATVGHDSVLGSRVTVLPGANVSGGVRLEDDVTVGSGAVVLQGLVVGAGAFVGAGAVVTREVAPGAVVVGSPARRLR